MLLQLLKTRRLVIWKHRHLAGHILREGSDDVRRIPTDSNRIPVSPPTYHNRLLRSHQCTEMARAAMIMMIMMLVVGNYPLSQSCLVHRH